MTPLNVETPQYTTEADRAALASLGGGGSKPTGVQPSLRDTEFTKEQRNARIEANTVGSGRLEKCAARIGLVP